jgi:polysaccharide pyruvyl transferase WcaK-like protein
MAILRRSFGDQITATVASYGAPREIARQAAEETDPAINHISLMKSDLRRWSWQWILWQGYHRLHIPFCNPYTMLTHITQTADVALEVGGDNYTLSYGLPRSCLMLDRYLQSRRVPIVLWGASVGPFEDAPGFAEVMLAHLRSLDAIYVRESTTQEYLRQHSVAANVHRVADPAFALQSIAPEQATLDYVRPDGAIGLNVSPLMANYVTGGDADRWKSLCSDTVQLLCQRTERDIVLVPHVTAVHGDGNDRHLADDHGLLERMRQYLLPQFGDRVRCAPATLSAAQTKWLIGRCSVFIGARMHSTIAAMSSLVPTISLVYSDKGRGLNDDLLGTRAYCIEPAAFTPQSVAAATHQALANSEQIRRVLAERVPEMTERAFAAGELLKQVIVAHPSKASGRSM